MYQMLLHLFIGLDSYLLPAKEKKKKKIADISTGPTTNQREKDSHVTVCS